MSYRLDQLAAALPYGFSLTYTMIVEGIPVLFVEHDFGATTIDADYTIDACLVIDKSAKVGSIIDRKTGIGRAFDLTVQLLHTDAVESLFVKPSRYAKLTSDLDYDEAGGGSNIDIETTDTWPSSGAVYIGNERIEYAATSGGPPITSFDTLTRGTPSSDWKAYDHDAGSMIGTYITDAPLWWRGRDVRLYAVPVDPYGRIHGATIHSDAALIWQGRIELEPTRTSTGQWQIQCRSFERRLNGETTAALSGTAQWGFDEDPIMDVPTNAHLKFYVFLPVAGLTSFDFDPWLGLSGQASLQTLRTYIADGYSSGVSYPLSTYAPLLEWRKGNAVLAGNGISRLYRAWIQIASDDSAAGHVRVDIEFNHATPEFVVDEWPISKTVGTSLEWHPTPLVCDANLRPHSLTVKLDKGDPSDVPSSGVILVETDADEPVMLPYDSRIVRENDILVFLQKTITTRFWSLSSEVIENGMAGELSVSFIAVDEGSYRDTMRRALMSSGRGDNDATYDTLDREQGYDIETVDTDSFDAVLDDFWMGIAGQVESAGKSFEKLYSGLLALSQRGLAPVPNNDGTAIDLTMVRTNVAVTSMPADTITDSTLATERSGVHPVRPLQTRPTPNIVEVTAEGIRQKGSVINRDVVSVQQQGAEAWKFSVYGLAREILVEPVYAWAQSLFIGGRHVLAVEIDVPPYVTAEVGDMVDLDLSHHALWQLSTGKPGYVGQGRVIGKQVKLVTGLTTLTLLIDGAAESGMTLCPAAQVIAWTGPAANPTAVDIDVAYLDIMQAYLASSNPFEVVVYDPSLDTVTDRYDVSNVTEVAGPVCRLAVTISNGAPVVTTSHYITLPASAQCNTAQTYHLHIDSEAEWR